jgi:hypothetical protein
VRWVSPSICAISADVLPRVAYVSASHADAIAACFAPRTVHYFPHRFPLLCGDVIGSVIAEDIRNRGGEYFIDRMFANAEQYATAVEWSRTYNLTDRIMRGYEFYEFDRATLLVSEIRGYFAAAPNRGLARHEIVGFGYGGRGYKTLP